MNHQNAPKNSIQIQLAIVILFLLASVTLAVYLKYKAQSDNVINETQAQIPTHKFIEPITKMPFVQLEKSCYIMGSPSSDRWTEADERQHSVCLKQDIWMGQYEVSQAQWEQIMGESPAYKQLHPKHPITEVSWYDIQSFIQKLQQKTGQQFRLPTEAEWEYAVRANTTTRYYWGNELVKQQMNCYRHYCGDDIKGMAKVGEFPANPFGLYDMLGNVWEWTCSLYDKDYQGSEQQCINADVLKPNQRISIRGGSWASSTPRRLRSADRHRAYPNEKDVYTGFRLVWLKN